LKVALFRGVTCAAARAESSASVHEILYSLKNLASELWQTCDPQILRLGVCPKRSNRLRIHRFGICPSC
jgi:hypothetical protein